MSRERMEPCYYKDKKKGRGEEGGRITSLYDDGAAIYEATEHFIKLMARIIYLRRARHPTKVESSVKSIHKSLEREQRGHLCAVKVATCRDDESKSR